MSNFTKCKVCPFKNEKDCTTKFIRKYKNSCTTFDANEK